MKVALVANRLAAQSPTGVDRYARELVRAVAARGDVACVAAATRECHEAKWVPDGVSVRHVPGPRKAVHLAWGVTGRPRVDRFLGHPDLVHVTTPSFPVPSLAPIVYTVHDLMTFLRPEWFARVHRWGTRRALEDAADRAAAIIADSPTTAAAMVSILGVDASRVVTIPLGIGDRFLAPTVEGDVRSIARTYGVAPGQFALFVGQVSDRKNVRVLVQAIARLEHPFPLLIAGPEGVGTAQVREEIDALGLQGIVQLIGFVADADLPALMAAARVLLHPSHYEGFGFTPLEAMAVGTPAVVAGTTALPDTVGDAALLADPDDPDAWAAAMTALEDEDLVTELVGIGRKRASEFTWARTAAATVEVYRDVLDGRRVTGSELGRTLRRRRRTWPRR